MQVKEKGTYRLLEDFAFRGLRSIVTIPKGSYLKITQVDRRFRKVIGPALPDWQYWNLPVEKVEVNE